MKTGLYVGRVTESGTKVVHIPEEITNFHHMNQQVRERKEAAARRQQQELDQMRRADAKAKGEAAREARNLRRLLQKELKTLLVAAAIYVSLCLDLVTIWFAVPVMIGCLTALCCRAGAYFGRYRRCQNSI